MANKKLMFQVAGQYEAASSTPFSFVDPVIQSIFPAFGPKSGGTEVQISGEHLNFGRDATVRMGKQSCRVKR